MACHPWMMRRARRLDTGPANPPPSAEDRYTGKGSTDRNKWCKRRRHVRIRARERFRIDLSNDDIALMEDGIRAGCSIHLGTQAARFTELHEMNWDDKTVYPVYDTAHGYIRTILSYEYARNNFRL